jgi:outer membrane beta-barrel protein
MRAPLKLLAPILAFVGLVSASPEASAGAPQAEKALDELNTGRAKYNVVQNRFFLKENRFELAPVVGYVPNNPFAKRYVGGLLAAYHFSENFAAEGAFMYSPDLGANDLKDLTTTLVNIAHQGAEVSFQQPVDKLILGATFAARWAPVYGKINLLGERVLNFDFYGVAGLGMLSINEYYATCEELEGDICAAAISTPVKKVKVPVNLGVGMDFFLSGSVAVKIDARSYLYLDKEPQYDPNVPVEDSRLYNAFVASTGVSIFFPKMKPRQLDY